MDDKCLERKPNTEYVLSLSYGKDSLACLAAIEELGWPLDRIVHAEVWATDTIPADLPPMVEFKAKADEIINKRWGIAVEHICAMRVERERERDCRSISSSIPNSQAESAKEQSTDSQCDPGHGAIQDSKYILSALTYEQIFYTIPKRKYLGKLPQGTINGFPLQRKPWCNSKLKTDCLTTATFLTAPLRGELT